MKPTAHNDIESWRHDDVNLRRALEKQNEELPALSEGFEERMMMKLNNLAAPTSSQPAPTKTSHKAHRLWPFAAALSTAAMLAVAYVFFRPKEAAQVAEVSEIVPAEIMPEDDGPATTDALATPDALAANTLTTNDVKVLPGKERTYQSKDKATATNDAASLSDVVQEEKIVKEEVGIIDNVAEEEPSTTDTSANSFILDMNHLNHLVAEATNSSQASQQEHKYNNVRAGESASRVALSVNIGSDGGLLANANVDEDINALNQRTESSDNSSLTNSYYFSASNGYAFDNNNTVMVKRWRYSDEGYNSAIVSKGETSHKLPVVVGANLSIPISRQWFAETGLTYTRLRSTTDYYGYDNYHHCSQRIHYLGIPLRAQFRFLNSRFFTAYATAGGSVEIPVKATLETTSRFRNETTTSTASLSAPVQFSTTLSLGAQFNCNSHFGIFAEPQLQWFIPTGSDIETYRTEHPLRFVPAVGLRWTL